MRYGGRVRLLTLAAVVLSLALGAAGCGGDDDSAASVDEWAEELCTSVQEWMDELQQIGDELGDDLSRESLEASAEDANAVTEDFIESLRDLGPPETESENAIDEELDELADIVENERDEIREAVEDAEGLGGAGTALGAIGASVAEMGNAVEQTLRTIDEADTSGEVRNALDDAESCDELRD
jgi:hypothetical protein